MYIFAAEKQTNCNQSDALWFRHEKNSMADEKVKERERKNNADIDVHIGESFININIKYKTSLFFYD